MAVGGRASNIKNSVIIVGVPSLEKTAPKKFDAHTKTIINVVISNVFKSELLKDSKVKLQLPSQPIYFLKMRPLKVLVEQDL